MSAKNEPKILTAAECACRTGLTVRALRVYEDLGLISPQRTASGWRYYGERELIRLNTITLLKSAGLTLAQIRTATSLNEHDPSLQHVLEMQVDAWKAKQTEAARGQAIVEMALKSLKDQQTVSIDDLCNLVRSLEMSSQNQDQSAVGHDSHGIELDIAVLDRYVGVYRYAEFSTFTVTRDGNKLLGQLPDTPVRGLIALTETEFLTDTGVAHVRFIVDAQGPASSVIMYQSGIRAVATRVDVATVTEMQSRLAAKIGSQQATPGSEAALRRILVGIASGVPNYDEMTSAPAQAMRQQLPQLQAINKYLGAIQSLEFSGVGARGWDVYEVRRENGSGQWRISLNSNGLIEGASAQLSDSFGFSTSASEKEMPIAEVHSARPTRTPGSETALVRMIDGIRSGVPNYEDMSPLLAQSIRQQLTMLQTIGKRLGGMVSVDYKGSLTRSFDIYDLHRENGTAQWRIALNDDGTIAEANAILTGTSLAAGP